MYLQVYLKIKAINILNREILKLGVMTCYVLLGNNTVNNDKAVRR